MKTKLITGLTVAAIFYSFSAYNQEKGDLGINLSSNQAMKLALEYRTAQKGQYNWRIAYTFGEDYGSGWKYSPQHIISSSDSLIVYDYRANWSSYQTLRLGLERQFKSSIFSVSTDLTIGYQSKVYSRHNIPYILTNYGWTMGSFSESDTVGDVYQYPGQGIGYHPPIVAGYSNFQSYRQHFVVAGLRLGFNMDLPIKKAFILHTGVTCHVNTPLYMGTTKIHDFDGNLVILTPPSLINLNVNAEIGLRYNIGTFKNRERKNKG